MGDKFSQFTPQYLNSSHMFNYVWCRWNGKLQIDWELWYSSWTRTAFRAWRCQLFIIRGSRFCADVLVEDVSQVEPCTPTTISAIGKTSTGQRKRQRKTYDEINEKAPTCLKKESIKLDMEFKEFNIDEKKNWVGNW